MEGKTREKDERGRGGRTGRGGDSERNKGDVRVHSIQCKRDLCNGAGLKHETQRNIFSNYFELNFKN